MKWMFERMRELDKLSQPFDKELPLHEAVAGKDITITGYIVKTNLPEAPACAVHKTGKGDKEDCKAAVPAFWIADEQQLRTDRSRQPVRRATTSAGRG